MKTVHPSKESSSSVDGQNSNNNNGNKQHDQLYECVKCELLFRNHDMYMKHKKLHENAKDDNNNETTTTTTTISSSNLNTTNNNNNDNNNNIMNAEFFKCSLCHVECSSAIHYLIHIKTEHQLEFNNNLSGANLSSLLTNMVWENCKMNEMKFCTQSN